MAIARRRSVVAWILASVIAAGLLSRTSPLQDAGVGKEVGDTLWAVMFYLWVTLVSPRVRPAIAAAATVGVTFAIEFLKLYHAPWIDHLRGYRPIGFLLGHTFYWHDLACYALGVGMAFAVDGRACRRAALRACRVVYVPDAELASSGVRRGR